MSEVTEYLKKIGSLGGRNNLAKHGRDHMKHISRLGVVKKQQLKNKAAGLRNESEQGQEL